MKLFKGIVFLFGILFCLTTCNHQDDAVFNKIYTSIKQDNFFKAKELYNSNRDGLSKPHQQFVEAFLNNAFNRHEESEEKINLLIKQEKSLPDSLQFELYKLKTDNSIKLYKYKEAKNAILTILSDYKEFLTNETLLGFENVLKIWTALENTPPQKVDIQGESIIKMEKDLAGLNNLKVSRDTDSLNFIFDTGANLSTTIESVAKQLKMKIIPVDIEVNTITGSKVQAQLAVCDRLTMGHIEMHNVVFLVLPDEGLSFPQINYQIYGILGFPVIEALKEIRITKDGNFIVPEIESTFTENSNMAMDGLTPLIYIDKRHFTFDTGANKTILYNSFYLENKEEIDSNYPLKKISFSGASGMAEFDGFEISQTFTIGKKEVSLENVNLLTEKISESETVYGNIGQDIIQQFDTMILNFNQMFIQFE